MTQTDTELLEEHRFSRRARALGHYYHAMMGNWPDKLCSEEELSKHIDTLDAEISFRGLKQLPITRLPDDLF